VKLITLTSCIVDEIFSKNATRVAEPVPEAAENRTLRLINRKI